MIPIKSETIVFSRPVVTWVIIAINVIAYVLMTRGGDVGFQRAIFQYATIPRNVTGADVKVLMHEEQPVAAITADGTVHPYNPEFSPRRIRERSGTYYYDRVPLDVVEQNIPPWMTLFTMMFMHAGLLHLAGNMWTLWVFGPNVEDALGRGRFLFFYLACGLGAAAAQLIRDHDSTIPFLGASGAIAGVMGGFAVRFPGTLILTLIPIFMWAMAHLPAWIFMLIYIGEQIFMSVVHSQQNGGVAWWAHIGGFATGYFLVRILPMSRRFLEAANRHRPRRVLDPYA